VYLYFIPAAGGSITIIGSNFKQIAMPSTYCPSTIEVIIGGEICYDLEFLGDYAITCTAEPGTGGLNDYTLVVTANGKTSNSFPVQYGITRE
jgi:IPT/TIG domain